MRDEHTSKDQLREAAERRVMMLGETEELFRQIAEAVREVLFVVDHKDYSVLYVNPAYETIWGRTCESLYEEPFSWSEAIFSEDRERVNAAFEEQQRTGEFNEEFRITRPDGSIRWIHDRVFAIQDPEGGVYRLVGIAEDITERKRAEEALRRNENKYRALIDQSPDPVFVSRVDDFTFTEVNDRACANYGYSREEFLTMQIFDIETEAPLRQQVRDFYDATAVGQVVEVDGMNKRKDGSIFPVEVRFTKLDDEFALAVVRDISERKRAEQALRRAQTDGFILTDLDGTLVDVNPAYCELVGFTRDELLRMNITDLETSLSPGNVKPSIAQIVEQGGATFETTARRKDGGIVELEISTVVLEHGRTPLLAAFARDITERKRLEREVAEISAWERRRIGHDLHDTLGQHLTGLAFLAKGLADSLGTKSLPEASNAQTIERLANDGIVLTRKLASGLFPVAVETGGLLSALEKLASDTGHLFEISCVAHVADGPVIDDELVATHLYSIAVEAVANSTKHAEAKNLVIELTGGKDGATLVIKDDGVGVSQEEQRTPGLGLRIMSHRASIIGASLTVEPGPEGGTVVRCSLPPSPHSTTLQAELRAGAPAR